MRYTTSDLALSRNTKYLCPNQDDSDKLRIIGSGFAQSELLPSQEVRDIVSDRAHSRGPRYISDGSLTNRHFTSDLQQAHETGYGAPDPPQLREMRHTVSDSTSSLNSKYISPSKEQLESPRFRHSGQPTSRVSRFSGPDEPLTKTVLKNIASKLVAAHQLHEHGVGTSKLSQVREASSIALDRVQSRESKHTSSQLQESRYFTSDRESLKKSTLMQNVRSPHVASAQTLEHGLGLSEAREAIYTLSDLAHRKESRSTSSRAQESRKFASGRRQSPETCYESPEPAHSSKPRYTVSNQMSPQKTKYMATDQTASLQNVRSPHVASAQTLEHGLGLSEAHEAIYTLSDLAHRKESRSTSDRAQESRKFASDRRQSPETCYESPEPSHSSKPRYTVSNQMSPQKTKYMATNRTASYDSRYETPNEDQPKKVSVRSADQPPTRDSRFSAVDETLTVPAVLENLRSTYLASEQPRESGFGMSELTHLREVSYPILYQAKYRDSRYIFGRAQESKFITSGSQQLSEADYVDSDSSPLHGTRYKASDQASSQDPKSLTSNRDQPKTPRLRCSDEPLPHGSRLRDLDEPPVEESVVRASDQKQSKVRRFMERDPLHSHESGRRISDPQQFRGIDKTDLRAPHSRKNRL